MEREKENMPDPRAISLQISPLQQDHLQHLVRCSTSQERLVRRGKIILAAAAGVSNTKIAQELHVDHETVRLWRERWHIAAPRLQTIEASGKPRLLRQAIEHLLTDQPRPGAPATFTGEQFLQIMALACEAPASADRPVSAWTPCELADEAVKRGIVKRISPRTVERFLKGERVTASSQAVLAHSTSRGSRHPGDADLHGM
jgi:putative transposase